MHEIKIAYDNGTTETRTLDEHGQANGPYYITNNTEVIESGNLKNGKKDGLCDDPDLRNKLKENDPDELAMSFYKEGKKQVFKTVLMHTAIRTFLKIQELTKKVQEYNNTTSATEMAKAHYFLSYIQDVIKKIISKIPKPRFRESFVPEKKETNHDILKKHSKPQFRESFVPIKKQSNYDILKKHSEYGIQKSEKRVILTNTEKSKRPISKETKLPREVLKKFQETR